jgi:hypothetical protein
MDEVLRVFMLVSSGHGWVKFCATKSTLFPFYCESPGYQRVREITSGVYDMLHFVFDSVCCPVNEH